MDVTARRRLCRRPRRLTALPAAGCPGAHRGLVRAILVCALLTSTM